MTIRIVVDSSSDIGREMASHYDIAVVSQTIIFGDEEYQDGVDLDASALFEKIQTGDAFPRTAAASVGLFESAYHQMAAEGATSILSLHIADKLSGTYNAARLAAEAASAAIGVPIRVMDSGSIGIGCGLPALLTARIIQTGCSLDDAVAFFKSVTSHSQTLIILDTLEYIQKGGRLGNASALGGDVFNLKLILSVHDGAVVPLARDRTRSKLLGHLTSLLDQHPTLTCVGFAATDEDTAANLRQAIRPVYNGRIVEFSPSAGVSVHTGPRAGHVCVVTQDLGGAAL